MDEIVVQAMAKWPQVPDCFGWLGLDKRGHWCMRDERVQQEGAFQSGGKNTKGSVLVHEKLVAFIQRNYESDAQGRWYFQNGPQRVFVELASAPYVWRLDAHFQAVAQTGVTSKVLACLVDEAGHVYLNTTLGFGLVHTLDVHWVALALEKGLWTAEECRSQDLPHRFHFVMSPQNS